MSTPSPRKVGYGMITALLDNLQGLPCTSSLMVEVRKGSLQRPSSLSSRSKPNNYETISQYSSSRSHYTSENYDESVDTGEFF